MSNGVIDLRQTGEPVSLSRLQWPALLLCFLLVGYLTLRRSFAHIGVPPLYIGEVSLLALMVFWPAVVLRSWSELLFRDGPLTVLGYSAVGFVVYGMLQCLRGLDDDHKVAALQNFVFHVYVAFLFAGIWLGKNYPNLIRPLMYGISWVVGIYGVLYLVFLASRAPVDDLNTAPVAVFGQPGGAAISILALLSFENRWRRMAIPLMLNGFTLLGNQVRAEWMAFAVAVFAFAVLTGRISRVLPPALVLAGLLLVGLVTDFKVAAPTARGGEISTREIVGRAVASVDPRAAAYISPHATFYASTISWRTGWWENILRRVHESPFTTLFGHGYAFPIWELHPEGITKIRTPHNIAMFCLAYTGWIGVIVYYLFHGVLGLGLWRAFRLTGDPFGICLWIAFTVWAPVDNLMEAPYGAIPFYLLCGMQLAPLLPNRAEPSPSRAPELAY